MQGAPALSGTIGALLPVINACLVDGFNLLALDSLIVSGNVATGTKASHGYIVNQVVRIAGATPAGLNGEWRVASVTSSTFTFATTGISDQAATGTITAKTPAAGWQKQFNDTNRAVYRSGNSGSTLCAIRVDDTTAQYATVLGAESYTDISTAVNSIGTHYFKKSNLTDANARPWMIVADDKTFYIGIQWNNNGSYDFYSAGDFATWVTGDAFNFRLQGALLSAPGAIGQYSSVNDASDFWSSNYSLCPRAYSQVLGAIASYQMSLAGALGLSTANAAQSYCWAMSGVRGHNATLNVASYASPSLADNGYHFVPVYVMEIAGAGRILRGMVRGLLHVIENQPQASGYTILTGVENVGSSLVVMVKSNGHFSQSSAYPATTIAFDLGNW